MYDAQCSSSALFCCPARKICLLKSVGGHDCPNSGVEETVCEPHCPETTKGYPQSCHKSCGTPNFPNNWMHCKNGKLETGNAASLILII